jgi:hypothetical protein
MQLFFLMFVLRFAITLSLASAFWYSVYGQGGKLDKATEMFTAAQELGLPIDEKIYTNMLNCYGKSGQFLPCVDKSEKNSISTVRRVSRTLVHTIQFAISEVHFRQGSIGRHLYYSTE